MTTQDLDHLTAGPWHPLTISGGNGLLAASWAHPARCPDRCRIGRLLLKDSTAKGLPGLLNGLPAGRYRLRWSPRGVDVQHADGADVPGRRPTPPEPVALTDEEMQILADAGDEAVNAANHADQCGCDTWPTTCHSDYQPGTWDAMGWYTGLPAVLAAWEQLRAARTNGNPE